MLVLSEEQIRRCENEANAAGLSFEQMMQNAGNACANYILQNYKSAKNTVILCGKGKNGGDGYVIARVLQQNGINVTTVNVFGCESDALSEKMKNLLPNEVKQLSYTKQPDLVLNAVKTCCVLVDAVFGIGFKGLLPLEAAQLFKVCNITECRRISVDVPSGLCEQSCSPDGCFLPHETLAILALKKVHAYKPFKGLCGKVSVIDIGFTTKTDNPVTLTLKSDVAKLLPARKFDANKGNFGKALIIAGSRNMPGAAVLAARGTIESGAGLTTLAFPDEIYFALTAHHTECLFLPVKSDFNGCIDALSAVKLIKAAEKSNAVAFGCGVTVCEGAEKVLKELILGYSGTLIIDADGINMLCPNIDILKKAKGSVCITPHPGEMGRLIGKTPAEVNAAREQIALGFAKQYGVNVLLKGANTVIASANGEIRINSTGCPAMARGGSGDLLTGIITAFAAQGLCAFDALTAAAYIHALAGEIASAKYSEYSATVNRIADCLPDAFLQTKEGT